MAKVFMIMGSKEKSRIPPLFLDLANKLIGDIDCRIETLHLYSDDASGHQLLPQAIIYPKHTRDIAHVLSFAREYKIPVTVCGNRSSRSGGSLGEGIILDMTRYFSTIRMVTMENNLVTVDTGVTLGDLAGKLALWNLEMPLITGAEETTTIGAFVATKGVQASSFTHGSIREWVEELTIVTDNGEEHRLREGVNPSGRLLQIYQELFPLIAKESGVIRAAKPKIHEDASGYHLWNTSIGPRQLIDELIGSEGTLAIITSVTLRVIPKRNFQITTLVPARTHHELVTYTQLAQKHHADQIFFYDETCMHLIEKYYGGHLDTFTPVAYILVVTHKADTEDRCRSLHKIFVNTLPVEDDVLSYIEDVNLVKKLYTREFRFSLYDMYSSSVLTPNTSGEGITIPFESLSEYLEKVTEYLNRFGKIYTLSGYIGSGNIAITMLFDTHSKTHRDDVFSYERNIFRLATQYGGGISATSGDGIVRTPFLSYHYSEQALELFKKVKHIWDPLSILNPGKKIDKRASYLQDHFK